MSDQFSQDKMKAITTNYKFISMFVICFVSCATALFHYADQLLLMGYLEFFGYSLNIVQTDTFELLGIIFEVVKLCVFIVIVQVLGWYTIKNNQDIKKAITQILTSLRNHSKLMSLVIKNVNTVACVLLVLFYGLCVWMVLQFTGHLIASGVEKSLRMFGYTEGLTDIESDLGWIFRDWFITRSDIIKPHYSYFRALAIKYTVCIAPYAPAVVHLLVQKLSYLSSLTSKLFCIAVSIICVVLLYNVLNFNISGVLYLMGQQRAGRDIYFDTVVVDDFMYAVAYETDTHLYLTKCEYTDKGECLHIDTESRLCLNRENILISEFCAQGGSKSNAKVSVLD